MWADSRAGRGRLARPANSVVPSPQLQRCSPRAAACGTVAAQRLATFRAVVAAAAARRLPPSVAGAADASVAAGELAPHAWVFGAARARAAGADASRERLCDGAATLALLQALQAPTRYGLVGQARLSRRPTGVGEL